MVRARRLVGLGVVLAAVVAVTPAQAPAPPTADQARGQERAAILSVQTVLLAGRSYAASNGGLFDQLRCFGEPWSCIPGYPQDGASFLDPTYDWLQSRLGYARAFHPGPAATPDEIARAKASPSSLKAFAYTATPLRQDLGQRGLCGDSKGRLCMTTDGSQPPVKNGLCDPCRKLE